MEEYGAVPMKGRTVSLKDIRQFSNREHFTRYFSCRILCVMAVAQSVAAETEYRLYIGDNFILIQAVFSL